MSNRQRPKGKPFSLDRYRSEVVGEPFELWISDDECITISRPTGEQMFDAEEAARRGSSRAVVSILCGDQAERLMEVLGTEDAGVMRSVMEDLQMHFGMGE